MFRTYSTNNVKNRNKHIAWEIILCDFFVALCDPESFQGYYTELRRESTEFRKEGTTFTQSKFVLIWMIYIIDNQEYKEFVIFYDIHYCQII